MLRWWKYVIVALAAVVASVALVIWWFWDAPLLSPLTDSSVIRFLTTPPASSQGKVVYGFIPYWNLASVQLQPELTHASYFSLTIGADGSLLTKVDGATDLGYSRLQSDAFLEVSQTMRASRRKTELVISQFDNDDIKAFLSSPTAQQQLIKSLDAALLAYPVSGINVDIEYSGEVTPELRLQLVQFMTLLRQHLDQKYDQVQLSIDMYASASTRYSIWDVERLGPLVDYLIVMAYDFHTRSSIQAGPVAPLLGGKKYWDTDINQQLQAYVKVVPSHKLLLGVPFYGYEWQTTSAEAQAMTFPKTGSTASFKRVQDLLVRKDELQLEEHWNEEALSPYLTYVEDGETFVVYYENSRSLAYKLDYVNQLNLGGIAIWALGYEGTSRELWDVIHQKLYQQ